MSLTLQDLLIDRPAVEVCSSSDQVVVAMERMFENDFSQLPVVEERAPGKGVVLGLVSMASIARAALHLKLQPSAMKVSHAMDPRPITAQASGELWPTLERMRDGHALLVIDADKVLLGLLTAADIASYLLNRTQDLFALQEVETTLKALIGRHFEDSGTSLQDAVITSQKSDRHSKQIGSARKLVQDYLKQPGTPPPQLDHARLKELFELHFTGDVSGDFDRLSFHQYIELFLKDCWRTFGGQIDLQEATLRSLLHDLRDFRNRLAHHRGALTPMERDRLNFARQLLEGLADLGDDAASELTGAADLAQATQPQPASALAPVPAAERTANPAPEERLADAAAIYEAHDAEPGQHPIRALLDVLQGVPKGEDRITIRFHELERSSTLTEFVNNRLPHDARTSRSWWSNSEEENPNARLWLDAGWRMVRVNLTAETVTFGRNLGRNEAYIQAFSVIFSKLPAFPPGNRADRSPAGRSWQPIAYLTSDGSARLVLAFASGDRFRVELYLDTGDADRNKATFDALRAHAQELEADLGVPLSWERLDGKRACRVAAYFPGEVSVNSGDEGIEALAAWVGRMAPPFFEALRPRFRIVDAQHAEREVQP